MTSDRRCILVENENRVDVNIWHWLNVGFWLHNLKTTKSQRQLTSVLDINLTLTLDVGFTLDFGHPTSQPKLNQISMSYDVVCLFCACWDAVNSFIAFIKYILISRNTNSLHSSISIGINLLFQTPKEEILKKRPAHIHYMEEIMPVYSDQCQTICHTKVSQNDTMKEYIKAYSIWWENH